jgi:branched-subunit amino acid transport protein
MSANIWVVMVSVGILTFLTRLSFILIADRWQAPAAFRRALQFVPIAVLTAIIVPELVLSTGSLNLSPLNPRLIAGIIAIVVAWKTKNTVLTIVSGMAAFWVLGYFL